MNFHTPKVSIKPIAGALGAEISGVDLSRSMNEDLLSEIKSALWEYKVLFFRDQDLTPEQHITFGRQIGPPQSDLFVKSHDKYPELIELLKEADDTGYNFGGSWHSDTSYLEAPSMGVALYARELPPYGGDTTWTNMEMVYQNLSPAMQNMLNGLQAEHVAHGLKQQLKIRKGDYAISFNNADEIRIEVKHPVVRTHPETGNKSLFINPAYTYRFEDMTEEESKPLIDFLCQFAIRPAFTCRFKWEPGSLALWDNRNTMHFAINDYEGHRRLMHRYTIAGEKPEYGV